MIFAHSPMTINSTVVMAAYQIEELTGFPTDWASLTEQDLWQELVACILGSRVRHEVALKAVERLQVVGLLKIPSTYLMREFETRILGALLSPFPLTDGKWSRYPFPRARAHYMRRSAERIYKDGASIRCLLKHAQSDREARSALSAVAVGIGPKQASLFLRNVGFASQLAVLDTHICDYLKLNHLVADKPRYLNGLAEYEHVECVFQRHARALGVRVLSLDVAVWIVMRLVKGQR